MPYPHPSPKLLPPLLTAFRRFGLQNGYYQDNGETGINKRKRRFSIPSEGYIQNCHRPFLVVVIFDYFGKQPHANRMGL